MGLSANTPYLNTSTGIAMLFGRFLMMIPLLAAAGSLAQKNLVPVSAGTSGGGMIAVAIVLAPKLTLQHQEMFDDWPE